MQSCHKFGKGTPLCSPLAKPECPYSCPKPVCKWRPDDENTMFGVTGHPPPPPMGHDQTGRTSGCPRFFPEECSEEGLLSATVPMKSVQASMAPISKDSKNAFT